MPEKFYLTQSRQDAEEDKRQERGRHEEKIWNVHEVIRHAALTLVSCLPLSCLLSSSLCPLCSLW